MDRVCKSVVKTYPNLGLEEVEDELKSAVQDELIMAYKAVAQKGTNAGEEVFVVWFQVNIHFIFCLHCLFWCFTTQT